MLKDHLEIPSAGDPTICKGFVHRE